MVATPPLPQSCATAAAPHREPARHTALITRGPPVSMRVVVPSWAAFGGAAQSPPTARSALNKIGSASGGFVTRHTVTAHELGKRVLSKNSAGLGAVLCAGWMLETRLLFTRRSEKSKNVAGVPASSGTFGTTRIFAP